MRPGGEFVENIAEIREGLDIVEFAGFDQGINGGSTSAALVIAGEEKILPTYSHPAECSFDNVMPTPGLCRVLGANKKISGESRLLVIGLSALSKALKEGEQGVCGLVPGRHETARLGARGVASAPVERFKNSAITLSSRPAKPMFCCVIQSAKAVKIRRLAFSDWGA